jgi:phenylpyruvate tautomerase PptA (4-oxalocrotonate tautomerase family)
MPMCFIEAPQGLQIDAKRKLVKETCAALQEAYPLNDFRVFIREYPLENVGQDGELADEVRPICFLEAPQLRSIHAKRKLVEGINAAIAGAYHGLANTNEVMIFLNEYPLENAGWAGRLQSDNPEAVQALMAI